jgi:hypothetical protein
LIVECVHWNTRIKAAKTEIDLSSNQTFGLKNTDGVPEKILFIPAFKSPINICLIII